MREAKIKLGFEWVGKSYDGFANDFESFKNEIVQALEKQGYHVVKVKDEFLIV